MPWLFEQVGMLEAVSQAINDLLDGEQRDQDAGYGNRRVKRSNWRQRRHPKAGKAAQEIKISKNDEAHRHTKYDEPSKDFDRGPESSAQALSDRSQIKMIVAARSDGGAKEDRINEECRSHLLQPKPGVTDRACNYVENYRAAKGEQQNPAQAHQGLLKNVERRPLQMRLSSRDEPIGNGH